MTEWPGGGLQNLLRGFDSLRRLSLQGNKYRLRFVLFHILIGVVLGAGVTSTFFLFFYRPEVIVKKVYVPLLKQESDNKNESRFKDKAGASIDETILEKFYARIIETLRVRSQKINEVHEETLIFAGKMNILFKEPEDYAQDSLTRAVREIGDIPPSLPYISVRCVKNPLIPGERYTYSGRTLTLYNFLIDTSSCYLVRLHRDTLLLMADSGKYLIVATDRIYPLVRSP